MISLPIFIVSLAIGIFLVYITNPPHDVIYVYPTPENVEKIQYKDKLNNCFQYNANEVQCPSNMDDIEPYKMQ